VKHLFFSYSRQQLHYAEALVNALQKAGQEVWFDLQRLAPGSDWEQSIQQGLNECRGTVLLLSKSALASKMVSKEWGRALHLRKPIFIVMFDDVPIPVELQGASIIDTRGGFDATARRLLECVRGDGICQDEIAPSRWLPRAMEREPRRAALILLIDALVFLGAVFAIYSSALFNPENHWVNATYRALIPFTDRLNFLWLFFLIGLWTLWMGWLFVRRRGGSHWSLTLLLLGVGFLIFLSIPGLFLATLDQPNVIFIWLLCILLIILALANLNAMRWLMLATPTMLRWLPTGGVSDQQRQALLPARAVGGRLKVISYILEYDEADQAVAEKVRAAMKKYGHYDVQYTYEEVLCVAVVSKRTTLERIESLFERYPRLILVIGGRISSKVHKRIEDYQIVDYRLRNDVVLQNMASLLAGGSVNRGQLTRLITPRWFGGSNPIQRAAEMPEMLIRDSLFTWAAGVAPGCITMLIISVACLATLVTVNSLFSISSRSDRAAARSTIVAEAATRSAAYTPPPPTATPQVVTVNNFNFELFGNWIFSSDYEPYRAALQDHPTAAPIWSAATGDGLSMVALDYPAREPLAFLWTQFGTGGLYKNVSLREWQFGGNLQVSYFPRDTRDHGVLAGVKEWIFVIQQKEDATVFHVLGAERWSVNDEPPKIILDFFASLT